jgi:hypothetical protein
MDPLASHAGWLWLGLSTCQRVLTPASPGQSYVATSTYGALDRRWPRQMEQEASRCVASCPICHDRPAYSRGLGIGYVVYRYEDRACKPAGKAGNGLRRVRCTKMVIPFPGLPGWEDVAYYQ